MPKIGTRAQPTVTSYAKLWEDELGIIHVVFFECANFTIKDAKKYIAECLPYYQGKAQPVLFDARLVNAITIDAGQYMMGSDTQKATKAVAIVTGALSPIITNAMSLFMKVQKEPFPIKFFRRDDEALLWLEDFALKKN